MENIVFFDKDFKGVEDKVYDRLGIRGRRAIDLSTLGLPIVPGFVIDSELTAKLNEANIKQTLKTHITHLEKITGKTFGDPKQPLLLKIVLSSDLHVPFFPSIHNIGINEEIAEGFGKQTSAEFAYGEYLFFLKSVGIKLLGIEAEKFEKIAPKKGKAQIADLKKSLAGYKELLGDNCKQDVYDQLVLVLKKAAEKYCNSDIDVDNSLSIMVQAMVYGNIGANSYAGTYYTRNIIDGSSQLQGNYLQGEFDIVEGKTKDLSTIEKTYYNSLTDIAHKVEQHFKEIREIKFTIEEGNIWLVEQREVDEKSTQAHIKTLLELNKKNIVDNKFLVQSIQPNQLNELLHPVIDSRTIKNVKSIKGGIAGSTGAAIGRVYFSTDKLLEEYKKAIMHGEDSKFILVMPSTFAEDVKAIEVAQGVITCEGGFSSHAPVVARSLGKVAMVQPEMQIKGKTLIIGGKSVNEGDYISLNVPYYEEPTLYLGKVGLIEPNFTENGLLEFLGIVEKFIKNFDVRANADLGRDAELAKLFNAKGIGLCRTEHMFFNEKRIMVFREMILSDSESERRKALDKLRPMQRSDFYDLFKIMAGHHVTIRLLDAPLHEFLPRNRESMEELVKYMQSKNKSMKSSDVESRCDELAEMNPMLGHRGCRVAITYPEIYEMQCRAIFEATCMLKKEGIDVKPQIMIPIVFSEQELKFIKNGKKIEGKTVKGINDIRDEVLKEYGVKHLDYRVGSMIELPAAALRAGKIAQHAEFFSFGTNDLTQTTYGLSRDDSNSFFPSYSLYDLIKDNPFKVLGDEVKELIQVSAIRGRLVRPDLELGLCGEHGTDPVNVAFCMSEGLNYVSTSPYAIPLAKLAIAREEIKNAE